MTAPAPLSHFVPDAEITTVVDTFLAAMTAKTWWDVARIVREHQDILLATTALDELQRRMHRARRLLAWHRKRRITQLQEAVDLLAHMQQSGIDQGIRNHVLESLRRQPMGEAFMDYVAQVPELQSLIDTVLRALTEGPEAIIAAWQQQRKRIDQVVDEVFEKAGELGPEFRHLAEYATTRARAYVKDTSPQAHLRTQRMLTLLGGLNLIIEELEALDTLEDQRGIFPADVSIRRQLFARRAQALLSGAEDEVLAALGHIGIISILLASAQGSSHPSRQATTDELQQYVVSLERASRVLRRHQSRGVQSVALRLLAQVWGALYTLTGADTPRRQQLAILREATKRAPRRAYPEVWAFLQQDLGVAYATGLVTAGDIERSIHAFQQALQIFTQAEAYTGSEALTYFDLAGSYYLRRKGKRQRNLAKVIEYCDHALRFFPEEDVVLCDNCHLLRAKALEELGRLEEAHASLMAARRLQDAFVERSNSLVGLLDVLQKKHGIGDLYLRDIQVLLKLQPDGYEQDIAVALEEGRARVMRMALGPNLLTLQQRDPTLAAELVSAQRSWQEADRNYNERVLEREAAERKTIEVRQERWFALSEAATHYKQVRDRVRVRYPETFALIPTFEAIGQAVDTPDEALVYLVANQTAGLAVIITRDSAGRARVKLISLPDLTLSQIAAVLFGTNKSRKAQASNDDETLQPSTRPTGGYYYALTGDTLATLQRWGQSLAEVLSRLPTESHFTSTIFNVARRWAKYPLLLKGSEQPFAALKRADAAIYGGLGALLDEELLKIELERVLAAPGHFGLHQIARWLEAQDIHRIAIVPYGPLTLLPWPAMPIADEQGTSTFGERFQVSIVPSAYGYRAAKEQPHASNTGTGELHARPAIVLAGDPQLPSASRRKQLPYAESEIQVVASIAQAYARACRSDDERERHGLSEILTPFIGEQATRKNVLDHAKRAWFIELAAHGRFRQATPLRSGIELANGEEITLEECLDGRLDLKGTRLVILSACELSLTDVRWIENEALGMANGLLQSGVAGVIAPMWAVDDRATFLLMTRFAEAFLDPERALSPAQALAEAQHWLREEATNARLARFEAALELLQTLSFSAPISRRRSQRLEYVEALDQVHELAAGTEGKGVDPDALPYAHPLYWAGFVLTGC